jgi:hypothetical protein
VPPIGFTMSLYSGDDGKLHAEVSPPEGDEYFIIRRALLILRIWRESEALIRCSVHHPASGTTAYVQCNEEVAELLQVLHLELLSHARSGE